jgi:hypothetical protein
MAMRRAKRLRIPNVSIISRVCILGLFQHNVWRFEQGWAVGFGLTIPSGVLATVDGVIEQTFRSAAPRDHVPWRFSGAGRLSA